MEIVTGIFENRTNAENSVEQLMALGIPRKKIGFMTPGMSAAQLERQVPVTDSEEPGLGKAMGATVGGAMGAAGGATLGAAAASLAVPGVGPVLAVGVVAAALLAGAGAVTGAVAGEALEESLGEGLPHEDLYIYEEALRRGYSVVVAFADNGDFAAKAGGIMKRNGSIDVDAFRENWWQALRNEEQTYYQQNGRDFEHDELSYRRGFQAALHPRRRGKSYPQAEPELRSSYDDSQLNSAFRHGYERGVRYQLTIVEIRNT